MRHRWKLTAGLAALALGAAIVVPRLMPAGTRSETPPQPVPPPTAVAEKGRDIDVVLCLDTSNSMDDLIDSARARLWDVVNEVGHVEPNAHLRVALLSYGTPASNGEKTGFVVLQSDLTDDLDTLYATLWKLRTNGGDEYVGWVVDDAVKRLAWSEKPDAAHLIFVAGNESALQGPVDPIAVAGAAKDRGFKVNAIYAGDPEQGRNERWDRVAEAGGGRFTAISAADGLAQIATPQDGEIQQLNDALNQTYLPYGAEGAMGHARMLAQDQQAGGLGAASSTARAVAKGSGLYRNTGWDLVDAAGGGKVDVAAMPAADLPAPMQAMAPEERKAFVAGEQAKRKAIQDRMSALQQERQAWIDQNAKKDQGLGTVMKEIVDDQL